MYYFFGSVEIYCHGMAHFKAFWNWLDMVILGVSFIELINVKNEVRLFNSRPIISIDEYIKNFGILGRTRSSCIGHFD